MLPHPIKSELALALAGVVLALWPPGVALGQQGVSAQGRIVNGTLGGALVPGATVVLHSEGPAGHQDAETRTDDSGSFQFNDFTPIPGATYGLSVRYQGALYGSDIDVSATAPGPVTLTVFEATDDETLLTVSSTSLLIGGVDKQSRLLEAFEIVTIVNSSDRTYVPGPEPMKLLRFGLPPGATRLQVDTALPGADVIQVDRGFAVTARVPPGEHKVLFAYYVPYTGNAAAFSKSFPYGSEALRIVVPEEIDLASPVLGTAESIAIGGRGYRLIQASSLERGAVIPIEIEDLPEPSVWDTVRGRVAGVRFEYVGPLGLTAFALVILVFALRRRPGGWRPGRPRDNPQAEVLRLLEAAAAVEKQFEAGLLDADRYDTERARLRQRLLILRDTLSAQLAKGVATAEGDPTRRQLVQ